MPFLLLIIFAVVIPIASGLVTARLAPDRRRWISAAIICVIIGPIWFVSSAILHRWVDWDHSHKQFEANLGVGDGDYELDVIERKGWLIPSRDFHVTDEMTGNTSTVTDVQFTIKWNFVAPATLVCGPLYSLVFLLSWLAVPRRWIWRRAA